MQSNIKTDKYNDVRTLLDYAFAHYTNYTDIPAQGLTRELTVAGGGAPLGMVTVTDPGTRLLLADGLTAGDVSVTLELPEQYVLGTSPAVYAVYTVNGQDKQESASVRVPATVTGLEELLERNTGVQLGSGPRSPGKTAGLLIGISLGCTVLAAGVAFVVVRLRSKAKKKSRH